MLVSSLREVPWPVVVSLPPPQIPSADARIPPQPAYRHEAFYNRRKYSMGLLSALRKLVEVAHVRSSSGRIVVVRVGKAAAASSGGAAGSVTARTRIKVA